MSKAKALLINNLSKQHKDKLTKEQIEALAADMAATQQRLGRAVEQNFRMDDPLYHWTGSSFDEFTPSATGKFGPGVYLSRQPWYGEKYVQSGTPQRMELFSNANIASQDDVIKASAVAQEALRNRKFEPYEFNKVYWEEIQKELKNKGFEGLEFSGSGRKRESEIVIFDNTKLRKKEAQFKDPKSGKLLAGATGAAVLAGGQSEDAEAGILGIKGFSDEAGRLLETGLLKQQSKASPQAIKAAANKYNKLLKESPGFARREDLAAMNDSVTKRTIESFKEGAKVYTPEDLLNMNAVIMPVKGDQSFIGNIQQVSGIPLTETITAQGGLGMLGGATLLSPRDARAAGLSASIEAPRNETAAYLYDLVNRANNKVGDKGLGMLLQRTGIEDYLRKAAYGDDISYLDRLFASLDLAP